jgi:UDP-GlcNAc3NAcA epimerase
MLESESKMKVIAIVGARPQFVKAAPVSAALRDSGVEEWMVHTGQHYDHSMSQIFFEELGIDPPAVNLGVGAGSHAEQTAGMLIGIERKIEEIAPDWVVVYGDTNSTLAGALAASKLQVPVAHVEAGLRSYNRRMPEEINRIITDSISCLLFAPTETALRNLLSEGADPQRVQMVGDVMYDAVLQQGARAQSRSAILSRLELESKPYVLATIHRAENTDAVERLQVIVSSLCSVSKDRTVIWPLHPRTRHALERYSLLDTAAAHIRLIDPIGYLDMVLLEKNACAVVTDSGGVQKEAYFHRVPCVTLRNETEWVETIESGWNRLAPPEDAQHVTSAIRNAWNSKGSAVNLYGDGCAARRIVAALVEANKRSQ